MAFKMNRSIIKGTANHKASIAKAKAKTKSIVAQASTKADASLVEAARVLGQSYKPRAIDFTIDQPDIKIPEKTEGKTKQPRVRKEKKIRVKKEKLPKVKKEKKPKVKKERRKLEIGKKIGKFFRNTAGQIVDAAGNLISGTVDAAGQLVDEAGNIVGDVLEGVDTGLGKVTSDISKGIKEIEQTIEAERNKIQAAYDEKVRLMKEKKLSEQQEKERIARWEEEMKIDIAIMNQQVREREGGIAVDEKLRSDEYSSFDEDPSKTLDNSKNPIDMRDDRIYRHAIKNGVVQRNMKKGGYIPPSER